MKLIQIHAAGQQLLDDSQVQQTVSSVDSGGTEQKDPETLIL